MMNSAIPSIPVPGNGTVNAYQIVPPLRNPWWRPALTVMTIRQSLARTDRPSDAHCLPQKLFDHQHVIIP